MIAEQNLSEIIECTSEWTELGERLSKAGYKTSYPHNRKNFVKEVERFWFQATDGKEFPEDLHEGLPGRVVERDGIIYVIHGLIHDEIYAKISDEYKESVRASINGMNVICEQGIKSGFSLDDSVEEMLDGVYFLAEVFPDKREDMHVFLLKRLAKGILKAPFVRPYRKIKSALDPRVRKMKKVRNLEDFREFRQYMFRTYLPELLRMNAHEYIGEGKYKNTSMAFKSMIQAKSMTEHAYEKGITELHALVGLYHEPQIKFFLENPEYLAGIEFDYRYLKGNLLIEKLEKRK